MRFSRWPGRTAVLFIAAAMFWPVVRPEARVEVRGNRELGDEEVRSILAASPERDVEEIVKRLEQAYIERGRLLARISVEISTSDSAVVLVVDEGEPARYGGVTVTGARIVSDAEVERMLGVEAGDRFVPRALRAGVRRVLGYYDASGHPFTQVWVDSVALDETSNTVDVSIIVVEGGREAIGHVEFEGLERTKQGFAVKLSGLKPGEPYEGEKIREARLRLSTSGAFDEVSDPVVRLASDGTGVDVLIRVQERTVRNSLSAAVGYADREGEQDRVLSGLFRLDLSNIGGSLKALHVLWRNDGQGRGETRLSFRDRFFLGRRLGLGVTLEQVGQDTLYTWQSAGVESSIPVGRIWGGLVGFDTGIYGDRNTFSLGDASSSLRLRVAAGASFVEGRDDRGPFLDFRTRHTWGRKTIQPREAGEKVTLSQYIFEAQIRAVADLIGNSHGAVELVYRGIESDENFVPLSEQFYLGGASSVRGYRENQYHGRRIAYARSEYRIGMSRRENGYLFVDGGYVLQESEAADMEASKVEKFLVGYGFGLRTESRAGNVDLSFGVGDNPSLRATKVHVILNRTF